MMEQLLPLIDTKKGKPFFYAFTNLLLERLQRGLRFHAVRPKFLQFVANYSTITPSQLEWKTKMKSRED